MEKSIQNQKVYGRDVPLEKKLTSTKESNRRQKREAEEKSPQDRRFDSIGWLIQGDDKCGASCFDGKNLLLSTNAKKQSELSKIIVAYMVWVAKSSAELIVEIKNSFEDLDRRLEIAAKIIHKWTDQKKECKKRIGLILSFAENEIKLYRENKEYKEAFTDSLNKITRSIRHSYLKPESEKALPKALVNALKKRQVLYLGESNIHAELKIVQKLIDTKGLPKTQRYIGISKRCCRNCMAAIKIVNLIVKNNLKEDVGEDRYSFTVRDDGHNQHFLSQIPSFLREEPYKTAFLNEVNKKSLEEAFHIKEEMQPNSRQQHVRSASEDVTSIASLISSDSDKSKSTHSKRTWVDIARQPTSSTPDQPNGTQPLNTQKDAVKHSRTTDFKSTFFVQPNKTQYFNNSKEQFKEETSSSQVAMFKKPTASKKK
jgi:hypothetical protein